MQKPPRILKKENYLLFPWKNGLGNTRQISIGPQLADFNSGNFDWRISTAAIVQSGPFSSFPGHRRMITLITGQGLTLLHGEEKIILGRHVPYQFEGDWETRCEIKETQERSPLYDLNLFWRPEKVQASYQIINLECGKKTVLAAGGLFNFIFLLEGKLDLDSQQIGEHDTLEFDQNSDTRVMPLGLRAKALMIHLTERKNVTDHL